jgi:hypothetical protein
MLGAMHPAFNVSRAQTLPFDLGFRACLDLTPHLDALDALPLVSSGEIERHTPLRGLPSRERGSPR